MFFIYYKNKLKNIINSIFQFNKPYQEVLIANYYKLPEEIEVSWFRDGRFIVGNIKVEGKEYKTQALSADEFIEMVNDTLYAVYEIPSNCIKALSKMKRFHPKQGGH